jgi:hypothetical protein
MATTITEMAQDALARGIESAYDYPGFGDLDRMDKIALVREIKNAVALRSEQSAVNAATETEDLGYRSEHPCPQDAAAAKMTQRQADAIVLLACKLGLGSHASHGIKSVLGKVPVSISGARADRVVRTLQERWDLTPEGQATLKAAADAESSEGIY